MDSNVIIETERLLLRQWNVKDANDIVDRLNNN